MVQKLVKDDGQKITFRFNQLAHNGEYIIYLVASTENPNYQTARWSTIVSVNFRADLDEGKNAVNWYLLEHGEGDNEFIGVTASAVTFRTSFSAWVLAAVVLVMIGRT